jgi:hypothetical protein
MTSRYETVQEYFEYDFARGAELQKDKGLDRSLFSERY